VIVKDKDRTEIEQMVDRFQALVETSASAEGEPWEKISAAIGFSVYDGDDTVKDVFRRADYNMYECKKKMKA
jgi:GGDEF domain-containing protein